MGIYREIDATQSGLPSWSRTQHARYPLEGVGRRAGATASARAVAPATLTSEYLSLIHFCSLNVPRINFCQASSCESAFYN